MSDYTQSESQRAAIPEIREIVRQAVDEFVRAGNKQAEPGYKTELQEERKRRECLETRLNQLVEENQKARAMAEETDRHSQIRSELQRLGVKKIDLAFRAVKDDIMRAEDGKLQAKGDEGKSLQDYVLSFVQENPELLPARMTGGSGAGSPARGSLQAENSSISIDSIRPGMPKEEMERVRQHIAKLASDAMRGL